MKSQQSSQKENEGMDGLPTEEGPRLQVEDTHRTVQREDKGMHNTPSKRSNIKNSFKKRLEVA